jgi:hypothetical protein
VNFRIPRQSILKIYNKREGMIILLSHVAAKLNNADEDNIRVGDFLPIPPLQSLEGTCAWHHQCFH